MLVKAAFAAVAISVLGAAATTAVSVSDHTPDQYSEAGRSLLGSPGCRGGELRHSERWRGLLEVVQGMCQNWTEMSLTPGLAVLFIPQRLG